MILLLAGCTPLVKLAYGIKDPGHERTEAELIAYLERKDLRTDNVLIRPGFKGPRSVPEVHVFDRTGAFVPYGEPGSCNAAAFDFLETLDRRASYATNDDEDFATFTRDLVGLDGTIVTFDPAAADFTVFIDWARWAGRLNIDHVRVWERQVQANDKAAIALYKISYDRLADETSDP